jgi:hypothetical protein
MDAPSPKIMTLLGHIEKALTETSPSGAHEDRLLFLGSWQMTGMSLRQEDR